jgi:hypothetical protein
MAAPSANMLVLTAVFVLLGTDARVTECRDVRGCEFLSNIQENQ